MGKATEDLRKEHNAILYVLKILDKMLSSAAKQDREKREYLEEVSAFLKIFADQCHHGKEETYLFPVLAERGVPTEGGPLGVMLKEHDLGRSYIALMDQALTNMNLPAFAAVAEQYRDLLINHIEKENNVLFVIADQILDEGTQNELYEKFEQHEETVIGHGVHEQLHAKIHRWADVFGI